MPIRHKDHFETDELENVTEEIVFEVLYHLIHEEHINAPEDPTCLQDVAAIALNSLPPKYAVSYLDKVNPRPERLEMLENLRKQAERELRRAIDIVLERPHNR